jgi:hypothetical protein
MVKNPYGDTKQRKKARDEPTDRYQYFLASILGQLAEGQAVFVASLKCTRRPKSRIFRAV